MANIYQSGNDVTTTAFIKKYSTLLDQKYIKEAVTGLLESNKFDFKGNRTISIPVIDTQGLGDYDRDGQGYSTGATRTTRKDYFLEGDRGTSFEFDRIDAEDANGLNWDIVSNTINNFIEQKVIPEVDAVRISKIAETTGITLVEEDLDATDTILALDKALQHFKAIGFPKNRLFLFVHSDISLNLGQDTTVGRRISVNTTDGLSIQREVDVFDGLKLVVVPDTRMFDKITRLAAPVTNNFDNTWTKSTGAKEINFILADKDAIHAITRHEGMRVFDFGTYQAKDAAVVQYRLLYDVIIPERQRGLVYVSKRQTAK